MDVLSFALGNLRLRSSLFALLDAHGPFALDCDDSGTITLYCVLDGRCFVALRAEPPIALGRGDIIMIPKWQPHVLSSDPSLPTITIAKAMRDDGQDLWSPETPFGRFVKLRIGHGAAAAPHLHLLTILFRAADSNREALIDCLPPVIHSKAGEAGIESLLGAAQAFIAAELAGEQPGFATVAHRLAELLLIQLVRGVGNQQPEGTTGWMRGLRSSEIAQALGLMHREPGTKWSLERLAWAVGMSRSAFAATFAEIVGTPPMSYLRDLRVRLATDHLAEGMSVKQAAAMLGYSSSYGFSRAVARKSGSPKKTLK